MLTQHPVKVRFGCGLGGRCGGPLQQVPSADGHAVQRTDNCVHRHQRLLQQLGQQPQAAPYCPSQVGRSETVKVQFGHIVTAG